MYNFKNKWFQTLMCIQVQRKLYSQFLFKNIQLLPEKSHLCCQKKVFSSKHFLKPTTNIKIVKYKIHDESSMSENESSSNEDFENPDVPSLRKLLYPNSNDDGIKQFNSCNSIQDVFNLINQLEEDTLRVPQICQSILVLWDLQNIYFTFNKDIEDDKTWDNKMTMDKYREIITSHNTFAKLLRLVERYYDEFSMSESVCTLLYLNKIGVRLTDPTMQKLVYKIENYINSPEDISLELLSRYTVAVFSERGYWPILVSQGVLSRINNELETCSSIKDLSLISICLIKMSKIVGPALLEKYRNCLRRILNTKQCSDEDSYKAVIKCIVFLNNPFWSLQHTSLIRDLILSIKDSIPKMNAPDLIKIMKVFTIQMEPANVLNEIKSRALELLKDQDINSCSSTDIAPDLLSCIVPFSSPKQCKVFEGLIRYYIQNDLLPSSTTTLYKLLRNSKTTNIQLCNSFWSQVIKIIKTNIKETKNNRQLFLFAYKYMHFNNNLGGTYRHYRFEREMIDLLESEIRNGMSGIQPMLFAKAAAFILAYGSNNKYKQNLIELVIKKAHDMSPQFNYNDCLYLSRSLQTVTELEQKSKVHSLKRNYTILKDLIENRVEAQLQNNNLDMQTMNTVFRIFTNLNSNLKAKEIQEIINKYAAILNDSELSSWTLRDICYRLLSANYLVPDILEHFVNYVIKQKDKLLGDTVEKILYLCYDLGYSPQNVDEFTHVASEVIEQDKHRMNGLSILQASIALCFYQQLPESLIKFVFTEDFLEQLNEEINQCYSKTTYPIRVRNSLMQLNRAVCLDHPEIEIPWFHQKYCDDLLANESSHNSTTFSNVLNILSDTVGGREYIKADVITPYNYKIQFLLYFDRNNQPVPVVNATDSHYKVAVLLLHPTAFTDMNRQMKGKYQMKRRHLEIMGYKNICVDSTVWNSIYLSEPHLKVEYLKAHLWPRS